MSALHAIARDLVQAQSSTNLVSAKNNTIITVFIFRPLAVTLNY